MSKDTTIGLEQALRDLPLFPLPQVVLFPHTVLPLHVFEPRYRAMLKDCLASHKMMAVPLIMDASRPDVHGHPVIASVAGIGVVIEHQALADGRTNILLRGLARVRLDELPFVPPYRRARGTLLEDGPSSAAPEDRTALLATVASFCADVRVKNEGFTFRVPENLAIGALADVCAHHLVIDARARQSILEQQDPAERARMVTAELAAQHALILRDRGGVLH